MSDIKSAYEKAMERFKDVEPDHISLKKNKFLDKGKHICVQKMQGEEVDIAKNIDEITGEEKTYFVEGIAEALSSQIVLPSNDFDMQKIPILKEISGEISNNEQSLHELFDKFAAISKEYLDAKTELAEQLKAQYMQMMQQQGQTGGAMDPNLLKAMQEQMKQLETHFQPMMTQLKQALRQLLGLSVESIEEEE